MLQSITSQLKTNQLKHLNVFLIFMLLYGMIIFVLSGTGDMSFQRLHLLQDVSLGILSALLALFLLAEQSNIPPNVRKYLAIGLGIAAFTELLHAFVGIEWLGEFAWIQTFSDKLRPTTWPPSTYVLPLGLLWAVWLMLHNKLLQPAVYSLGMAIAAVALYLLSFSLPPYLDTGLLGIQRPTQIPLLFLMLWLIVLCWRSRNVSPLFEGMAWMGVLLFLSDLLMLYSTSPHEKFAMMSHAGKLLGYSFLHLVQMRLAAENSKARMDAEASLLLEKKNLRDVMDELVFHQFAIDQHSIVGTTDVQGTIIYANVSFCNISGYSREELLGQNHRLLKSGEHPTEFFSEMYRAIAAGKVWKGEICNRAKDGHLYWVMTTIVPVMNEQGKPKQYISMRTDITEHKRIEIELINYRDNLENRVAEQTLGLKQAKEAAEAANLAKSEFLANMSHEIRTPMNGVVGVVDILQESQLTPAQQRMVNTIRTSSLALLKILGDVLDLSKIEAGKLEMEMLPVNLRELVESVAQVFSPTVADKNMDLIVLLPPDIPPWIRTDPGRLRQILFNLLSNAVKFSHSDAYRRGQVSLKIEKKSDAAGGEILHFRVIDNGIGMTAGTVSQLFNSFVQADASTTRRFGGTGLGLSISKHLAELLRGRINVNSILNSGTEFSLEIPLEIAPASYAPAMMSELSGMRVLIVNNHAAYQEMLTVYLAAVGAQVKLVNNQQAALDEIQRSGAGCCDVVLDLTPLTGFDSEIPVRKILTKLPVVQVVSRRVSVMPGGEYAVLANPLLFEDLVHTLALASGRISVVESVKQTERRILVRKTAPALEEAVKTGQLILVAEDNDINREVILEQLRILGYTAEAAEDGRIALEMWRSGRYSLLLTDCHMPNLDGFALTAAIRMEEKGGAHIPIIAVTGNAMQGEAQRCLASGMDDYLSKPLRLGDLGGKLARWMPQNKVEVLAQAGIEGEAQSSAVAPCVIAPVSPETEEAVWDSSTLTRMVGDHPEMHRRLLDKFLLGAGGQVEEIMDAVTAGDISVVANVAHKMKSAARTVGAMKLGRLCQELETSARAGDTAALAEYADGLKLGFIEAAEQIKSSFVC